MSRTRIILAVILLLVFAAAAAWFYGSIHASATSTDLSRYTEYLR